MMLVRGEMHLTSWRCGLAFVLLIGIGVPLTMPFVDLLHHPEGWQAWQELDRLAALAENTLRLMLGTVALTLPIGTVMAVLLYRTDLPGRGFFRFLTILALFVPLPVLVTAWQSMFGAGGWLPINQWFQPLPGDPDVPSLGTGWKPWIQGMPAAIFIHTLGGLPWVILIVGLGLRWVERESEEDAIMAAGPWRVLWQVTLPRCRTAIWAAGLWVALQTATEISATDMMQVRTFAEEVYTQLVGGGASAIGGSVAIAIPVMGLTWLLVAFAAGRLGRQLPPLENLSKTPLQFHLGISRRPCFIGVVVLTAVLIGVPVASLIWKTGLAGSPPNWTFATFEHYLLKTIHAHGRILFRSLRAAAVAGFLTSFLAVVTSWLATESRKLQWACLSLLATAWALPGPIIGFGLKDTIEWLLDIIGASSPVGDLASRALWQGPSPMPILWIYLIRFFPFALAMLWPVVRFMPREYLESARLDGARPGQELRHIILPLTAAAFLLTALAVMVLSLGEISASRLVETPGWDTLVQVIFDRMHYGVGNDLAALCLLLLIVVLLGGSAVAILAWLIVKKGEAGWQCVNDFWLWFRAFLKLTRGS
jgi:iron(III) transport system permease protein